MQANRRKVFAALLAAAAARQVKAADGIAIPGKRPMILHNDRPEDLETPVKYFDNWVTPIDAFFVRQHLPRPAAAGPAATDIRNVASINASYELPFGQNKAFLGNAGNLTDHIVSGWSVASITTLLSGFPFSPQLGYNPTGSGDSRNPVRPNVTPGFSGQFYAGGSTAQRVAQFFNPAAFSAPAAGYVGNAGRDSLIGPGFADLDLSLLKSTALSERTRLQFRAEFFNIVNHTNLQLPNEVVYSAGPTQGTTANQNTVAALGSPGVISATANTSRQIQLGLKLLF